MKLGTNERKLPRRKKRLSNTSESEKIASDVEREEHESDSVFDFLYHDVRRVGSFLAQFDDAGHLQGLTQSETVSKRLKRGWRFALGGGIPDAGATGEASIERGPAEGGSETSERVYDPLWTNARTFLDYLAERDMIQRDIHKGRIGQFVLAKGNLLVVDVTMLKNAWEKPTMKKKMLAGANLEEGNRHARRAQAAQKRSDVAQNEQSENIHLLRLHDTQAG
jgi:hypothetical protein